MTSWADRVRDRIWAAHPELLALGASGPSSARATTRIGPIVGVDFGVDYPWSVQITAGQHLPDPASAAAAITWARERDHGSGWCASIPQDLLGLGPWAGLELFETLSMWAIDVDAATRMLPPTSPGLELVLDPSFDEILYAYGGWMDDADLAERLVQPGDLERQGRRCIVARIDGEPVGCGFAWWACGTGYLSGIGVVERCRGRGIGYALTAAVARMAAAGPDGSPPSVLWMHATDEGAALYSRMGFRRIDTEVQVAAPGT